MKKNTKYLYATILAYLFIVSISFAQQVPTMDALENDTIRLNTGGNYILIPGLSDGDLGISQNVTLSAYSSDNSVAEVVSTVYDTANNFGFLEILEKGKLGSVTINVSAEDEDGITSKLFNLTVDKYHAFGCSFEVYDIIFWQKADPLQNVPIFDTILNSGEYMDPLSINWDIIPNTVSSNCIGDLCNNSYDFITTLLKGYIIPPTDGEYSFYYKASAGMSFRLSTDESYDNLQELIYREKDHPGGTADIGTDVGDHTFKSETVSLKANTPYAFAATNWVVHLITGGISWEGPGISKQYIPGENLTYNIDTIFPTAPENLSLKVHGTDYLIVSWDESTDNQKVKGYNIYVDGKQVNSSLINDTEYTISLLSPDTKYSIIVRAVDKIGNSSFLSNVLNVTTYQTDVTPPLPPTSISTDVVSGVALQLSWSGDTDGETEVVAYNLYVNGEKYNTDGPIYSPNKIIGPLVPLSDYDIEVESIDAGGNVSVKSTKYTFTTTKFNPDDTDLGIKTARIKIEMKNQTWSEGFGLNVSPAWKGQILLDSNVNAMTKRFKPGLIYWGNHVTNRKSFVPCTGNPTGENIITMADFMNLAIEMDTYCEIDCGVNDTSDWMEDPQTFLNFLEYLGGDQSTTWGSVRASEGYVEPLLPKCKGLVFGFGCEVWGGEAHWNTIGEDYMQYGQWCRDMATLMRTSPYYDDKRIKLQYSGRGPQPTGYIWGLHKKMLQGDKGELDWIGVDGYIGTNQPGYEEDEPKGATELEYFKDGIKVAANDINGLIEHMQKEIQLIGHFKTSHIYEGIMNSPSFYGRLGHGVITADYFATMIETGGAIPAIFDLKSNQWKISVPKENWKMLPLYYMGMYFNRYCKGSVLKTDVNTQYAIYDLLGNEINYEPVGVHAYTKDNNYSLLFFSRDFENDYQLQIDLPDDFVFNGAAKKFVITGTDYSTLDAIVDSSDFTLTDSVIVTIPKYSMVLITFTGEDQNFVKLPLGWYGDYIQAESVDIVPRTGTEILNDEGFLIFDSQIFPDSSLSQPKWEIISNDINLHGVVYEESSFLVVGSGECDGNGEAVIKLSAIDKPSVYDTIVVYVSGQESSSGCETSMQQDVRANNHTISVYPNPNSGSFSIESNSLIKKVEIFNLLGQKIYKNSSIGNQIEINSNGALPKGLYYVVVTDLVGKETVKVVIE